MFHFRNMRQIYVFLSYHVHRCIFLIFILTIINYDVPQKKAYTGHGRSSGPRSYPDLLQNLQLPRLHPESGISHHPTCPGRQSCSSFRTANNHLRSLFYTIILYSIIQEAVRRPDLHILLKRYSQETAAGNTGF